MHPWIFFPPRKNENTAQAIDNSRRNVTASQVLIDNWRNILDYDVRESTLSFQETWGTIVETCTHKKTFSPRLLRVMKAFLFALVPVSTAFYLEPLLQKTTTRLSSSLPRDNPSPNVNKISYPKLDFTVKEPDMDRARVSTYSSAIATECVLHQFQSLERRF